MHELKLLQRKMNYKQSNKFKVKENCLYIVKFNVNIYTNQYFKKTKQAKIGEEHE